MNATEDVIEITPRKKLKQARLPFQTISDSVVTSPTPKLRKRKLSTEHIEKGSKVGKLNENHDTCSELVIISDDESRDTGEREREKNKVNPLFKMVDNVWKKKQKAKATKQIKRMKHKTPVNLPNACVNNRVSKGHSNENKVQAMEIDEQDESVPKDKNERTKNIDTALPEMTSTHSTCVVLQNDKCKILNEKNVSVVETINVDNDCNNLANLEKCENLVLKDDANCVLIQNDKRENSTVKHDTDVKTFSVNTDPKSPLESKIQESSITDNDKLDVSVTNKNLIKNPINSKEPKGELESENSSKVLETTNDHRESNGNNSLLLVEKLSSNSCNTENNEKTEGLYIESSGHKTLETEKLPSSPEENRLEMSNIKDEINISSSSSKLGDSTSSNLSTPRRSNRNSENRISLNDSIGPLTPKQIQRKQEYAKKKLEREQEKLEREQKKQQEKEERQRLKREKEELKKKEKEEKEELKRKEKEEKEEQKKKEREEKERQRELEKKLKEEKEEKKRKEKEEKEEQKRKEKEAKEEEKRKKQEAMEQEKQEQELKKKKAAEVFANFFVPKQKGERDQEHILVSKNSMLSSFTKKADMRLAPIVRAQLDTDQQNELDQQMELQNLIDKNLYLSNLKGGLVNPKSNGKTWPLDDKNDEDDDDVMIIEDELPPLDSASAMIESEPIIREKFRPKLLSFHENRRPPYWGTWRKKSTFIKPRRPFGQDEKQLDYEVDSDEEWEEEEGESIDGSVAGSDEDPNEADEYEVDNELFVPHGYLSDEEATMDEDDVLSLSPEAQKARLKYLEDEFELELKKPTEKLKTRLYGLLWENSDGGKPELCIESLWNYFSKMAMIVSDPAPLLQPSSESEEIEKKKVKKKKSQVDGELTIPKTKKKKPKKLEENKEISEVEAKNVLSDVKKNQPGINAFLKKIN